MEQTEPAGEAAGDDTGYVITGVLMGGLALVLTIVLLSTPISNNTLLAILYIGLFAASCVALHLIFVTAPKINGKGISARVPKYFEYAYIVLLSVSLAQIALSSKKIVEYFGDNEDAILQSIQMDAKRYLEQCRDYISKPPRPDLFVFYTKEYCDKLERITVADAAAREDVIMKQMAADKDFMAFVIALAQSDLNRAPVEVHSIIPGKILRIQSLRELQTMAKSPQNDPFAWVSIVFLPLGLALRITKTSMELFGKLRAPA